MPHTDFMLRFGNIHSIEYKAMLQTFIDESIESTSPDYYPPHIEFNGASNLAALKRRRKTYENAHK